MESHESAVWSPKQEQVALLLAGGMSVRAAAKAAEAGERTLYDWLKRPDYRAYVAELRGEILSRTVGVMVMATTKAAVKLAMLLDDPSPVIQLRAATAILDGTIRLRDHTEIDARLLALEQAASEQTGKGTW